MERWHIPVLSVRGRQQTFPPEQLQAAASSSLHFVSLLIWSFTNIIYLCPSIGIYHSRTEDVEAAGASMMARPPSYSQLYHHRGHQDRLDHEDSEGGSQSSLGEPPPYKSGMTLSFSFKAFNLFSSNSDENINPLNTSNCTLERNELRLTWKILIKNLHFSIYHFWTHS